MKDKGQQFTFIACEKPIEDVALQIGVVYVCKNEERIDLLCPCNCGKRIVLNTIENTKPNWKLIKPNSISPSINMINDCKSHFTITNGVSV